MPNSEKRPVTHASPGQCAANRANAAQSTGPRSPEGKARSAQNARKHGFAAAAYTVVRLEDVAEVAALKDDAVDFYQPVNSQEHFAVERIALAQLALLRAARLEAGLFTSCLNEALDGDQPLYRMHPDLVVDIEVERAQNRSYVLADGLKITAAKSNALALYLRYAAQAERQYRRAVEEFDRLRALRGADLPACVPADETNPIPPYPTQNEAVIHQLSAPPSLPPAALPTLPEPPEHEAGLPRPVTLSPRPCEN